MLRRWKELEEDVQHEEANESKRSALAGRIEDRFEPVITAMQQHMCLLFRNLLAGTFNFQGHVDAVTSQKTKVGFYSLLVAGHDWTPPRQ